MASARDELQSLLSDIAAIAAARRAMAPPDQALLYAKMHWISSSAAQLIACPEIATTRVPFELESRTIEAARAIHEGIQVDRDVTRWYEALGQIDQYTAAISALPGKSTTSGGGF